MDNNSCLDKGTLYCIEDAAPHFAPVLNAAAWTGLFFGGVFLSRKAIPNFDDGLIKLGNKLLNTGDTVLGGAYNGLFNAGGTVLGGIYSVISYPFSTTHNIGSTVLSTIYNAHTNILNLGINLVNLGISIMTLTKTFVKYLFYANFTLAGGAVIGDLAISYNKQEIKFDLCDKYTKLLSSQKDLISSAFEKMPKPIDVYDFITKTLIPDLKSCIEGSERMYHEYKYSNFELEQKIILDAAFNKQYLAQLSDTNHNQQTSTGNSSDTNSSQIVDRRTQETEVPITEKEYIKLDLSSDLDENSKEVMGYLIANRAKLYVTTDEMNKINKFFDDKREAFDMVLELDKNKFTESELKEDFLDAVIVYEKLKDQSDIPESYKYCTDDENTTGCNEKPIVKIVTLCEELVSEKLYEVEQINLSIINALDQSNYAKKQVMESIKYCNEEKYDYLICSPLFEGAANEYFDSIES